MSNAMPLPPSNYLISYYQTLDEIIWLLRQGKNKKQLFWKIVKKKLQI